MKVNLETVGILFMLLALLHTFFPRYFHWKSELQYIGLINRQMMYIHALFIGLTLFLIGLLCLTSSQEIIATALGNKIALGLGTFCLIRLFIQFIGYSPKLWKGKRFETIVHILFIFLWGYFTVSFFQISLKVY